MKNFKRLALVAALASAAPLSAATIFDTGTPSGPAGYSVFDMNPDAYQGLAGSFTLSQVTRITGVDGYFGASAPGRDRVQFAIHASVDGVPGQPFGPALASQGVTIASTIRGDFDRFRAFADGSVVLGPGTYWASFTVVRNDPQGCICWMPANATVTIPTGAYTNNFTGQNWWTRELYFGMRVFGDSVTGAVPEPESWALLILGFGVLGGAMRSSSSRRTQRLSIA